jgi:hypothetical protein
MRLMGMRGKRGLGVIPTVILAMAALLGCKGSTETAPASAGNAEDGTSATATALAAGGTRVATVADATLNNIPAFSVTIPAGWKFQGTLLQGGVALCDSNASSVWKATGPDGLTRVEQLPQMLWASGDGPKPVKGCLPQQRQISAQDFLTHVAAMLHVDYVGPDTVPVALAQGVKQMQDGFAQQASVYAARNLQAPKYQIEGDAAKVRYKAGSVEMAGRLTIFLQCVETAHAGAIAIDRAHPGRPLQMGPVRPTTVDKCEADVTYMTAPQGQLPGLIRQWDAPGMGFQSNRDWGNAWVKRKAQQGQQITDSMIKSSWDRFNVQQKEIAHSMAVQQQEHDQFLATMQEGTNRSIARTYDSMNARSTAASDMVDYSLDRQTVLDMNSGAIVKIPDQVTPGGDLVKVHGNGQPY